MEREADMTDQTSSHDTELSAMTVLLGRIADSLERAYPGPDQHRAEIASWEVPASLGGADGFVWLAEPGILRAVERIAAIDLALLVGIDRACRTLLDNTRRFSQALPANNALIWGARGMGKSSMIKAVHGAIVAEAPQQAPALVEIHRDDIHSLPSLLVKLRAARRRFVLFCDDLSFDADDGGYKSLKAVLEGGIEGQPAHVLFYATSNRRHLMARDMIENESSSAIHPGETVEEKVSLSDRFGLWIGVRGCNQATYLEIVTRYIEHFSLSIDAVSLQREALRWAMTRGSRSGRVAWQFVLDLAGRQGVCIDAPSRPTKSNCPGAVVSNVQ